MNTILTRGGGNLNDPIFESSNARDLSEGRGMLKFRLNDRTLSRQSFKTAFQQYF